VARKIREDKVFNLWFKRLLKMSDGDCLNWSENLISGTGQALSDFRHTRDLEALLEAKEGAASLLGAIEALISHNS